MELIPLGRIDGNPWQTRPVDGGHARMLADDIRANGLLQAPVGRIMLHGHLVDPALYGGAAPALGDEPEARMQLALGHHRLAAYRLLAEEDGGPDGPWGRLPMEIRQLDSFAMALAAWSENEKRRDVNPLERARAMERMIHDFQWTQATVAEKLGVSRPVVSNALRLLTLPAEVLTKVESGELSERKAMALVPMYDLPATTLKAYEKASFSYPRPSELLEHSDGYSSDRLRERVVEVIEKATTQLDGQWIGYVFDDRYVKAPMCDECGERVQAKQGNKARCPHKACFERKGLLWKTLRLGLASQVTGIAVVPDELSYSDYASLSNVPNPGQIVAKGCANLRLRFVENGETRFRPDGFDDVEIICLHGKDQRCTCGQAAKAAATRADPDHQAERAAEKRIAEEIVEPACAAVLKALEEGQLEVWRMIATSVGYNQARGEDLATLKASIARGIAFREAWAWKDEFDFGQAKETFEKRLTTLGLALPWAVTPLEDAQRRYGRIREWIERREFWNFDFELNLKAIEGNVFNLEKLVDVVDAMDAVDGVDALRWQIGGSLDTLRRLAPVAEELNALRRAPRSTIINLRVRCDHLLQKEVGGLEHNQVLAQATAPELRYALLFADTLGRAQVLGARLAELEAAAPADVALPRL